MSRIDKMLSSKIEIPTVYSNVVERTKIIEDLRCSNNKVTVLNAGAGFGKTMLLLLFAKAIGDHCVWYSLSSIDNDLMLFMSYLTKAIQNVIPDFDFQMQDYSNETVTNEYERYEEMALNFAKVLSEDQVDDLYLIFDDFQEIKDEKIIRVILAMIQYTPENVRILISVKGAFPKFLARYLIQNVVQLYTMEQLAFSKDEIKLLIKENCYIDTSDIVIDKILEVTQGWPAGVMFTVLAIKQQGLCLKADEIKEVCMQQTVYDYIMYEIFRKLPYDIQTFLIHSSVLNILSADVCNVVMEINNAKGILDYLVQENLFTLRVSRKENVYRYHSIFQGFLQTQITEESRRNVLEKAAYYHLQRSDKSQAAEYGILLDNMEIVDKAVSQIGMDLLDQGQIQKLQVWLNYMQMKKQPMSGDSELVIARYYRLQKEYDEALNHTSMAVEIFRKEKREHEYVLAVYESTVLLRRKNLIDKAYELLLNTIEEGVREKVEQYLLQFYCIELELLHNDTTKADERARKLASLSITGKQYQRLEKYIKTIESYLTNRDYLEKQNGTVTDWAEIESVGQTSKVMRDYFVWNYLYRAYCAEDEIQLRQIEALRDKGNIEDNVYNILIEFVLSLCGVEHQLVIKKDRYTYLCESLKASAMIFPKLLPKDEEIVQNLYLQIERRETKVSQNNYLNVYCLGGFEVKNGNESIKWRTKKAMELFAYLYDKQGVLVSKDVIAEALWPEVDPTKGSNLFHTTLSYVRKALANGNMHSVIITVNKQYGLNMKMIKSDCRILMQMNENLKKENYNLFINKETILGIYRGSYMQGQEYSWITSKSEYYERIYLKCCEKLAQYNMKQNQLESVLYCLNEADRVDPYSEKNLKMKLECYYRQGDYKLLKSTYKKTAELYENDLGIGLSESTIQYYWKCLERV